MIKNKSFWNDDAGLSSRSNEWETPQDLFNELDEEFGFNIKQESGLDFGSFPNDLGDPLITEGELLEVGYTLLDGTDSSSTNAGSYLISESDPDLSDHSSDEDD